jgi:DNA polymerase III sliding clamp (beta) subunit (PCNA family)
LKFKMKVGELVEKISQAAITIDIKSVDQPNSKVFLRAAQGKDGNGVVYFYSTTQKARTFLKNEAEIIEAGEGLIDAAKLLGGLQGRDSELIAQVDVQDKKIIVSIGRNRFQLPVSAGSERLSKEVDLLPFKVPALATIQAGLLLEFIRRTTFCISSASNSQQKFAMDVLHLKKNGAVYQGQATDGNIFSLHYGPAEGENELPSLLIPQDVLDPLQKILGKHRDEEIELISASYPDTVQELFFRGKGVLFGCSLRSGRFPNISLLAEQHKPAFEFTTNREELKGALVRASNFVVEGVRNVQFLFENKGIVKIKANNDYSDIKEELEFEVISGEFVPMQVTLALDYIANVVGTLKGDSIILGVHPEKLKALVARREDRTDEEESKLIVGSTYAISPVKPTAPGTKHG